MNFYDAATYLPPSYSETVFQEDHKSLEARWINAHHLGRHISPYIRLQSI